jgi:hypothetical protein
LGVVAGVGLPVGWFVLDSNPALKEKVQKLLRRQK